MSNSKLATVTVKSPCYTKGRVNISRITIHHMAGVNTAKECGKLFANPNRLASSNYGIGKNADVGLYVDEKNTAWTSSSEFNDARAITIEVSNSKTGGDWPVSAKVYKKLIELCVDICKRNGKTELLYLGQKKTETYTPKSDEMILTAHRWFIATVCPGPYLYGKFASIAKEVTAELAKTTTTKPKETAKVLKKGKVIAKAGLNVRSAASTKGTILRVLKYGTAVNCYKVSGKWWKISATKNEWIYSGYVK